MITGEKFVTREVLNMNRQLTVGGRDAYFDNAKALLIISVVFGHTLSGMLGETRWMDSLYFFIYTFHMPAFIFVTGYYAKVLRTKKDWWKLMKSVVLPYIVFQYAYSYYYLYVLDLNVEVNFASSPRWGLWFLVSLFCWRLMLPLFNRSKWMIVAALGLALAAGYVPFISGTYSLSRTLFFFVFFIAGYHLSIDSLKAMGMKAKILGGAALAALFMGIYFFADLSWKSWFFGHRPYAQLSPFLVEDGMINRLLVYAICAFATTAFLAIVPKQKFGWTVIGQRTMAIYIFHLGLIQTFRTMDVYDELLAGGHYYVFLLFAVLTVVIFAHPVFSKLIQGDFIKRKKVV